MHDDDAVRPLLAPLASRQDAPCDGTVDGDLRNTPRGVYVESVAYPVPYRGTHSATP